MRVGLITPVCCSHEMQAESIACNRQFTQPDTPYIVLYNGVDPFPVPDGVIGLAAPCRFGDEQDLWGWCLHYAQVAGWDWCMIVHDDFCMREAGWEAQLAEGDRWRTAIASWCVYSAWTAEGNSGGSVDPAIDGSQIGVVIDPMSFGFRVKLFAERGCVTAERFGFGFGAWDSCAWALQQGYASWRIMRNSWHHWLPRNARHVLSVGAPGHPEIRQRWLGIALPAHVVDATHIETAGRVIDVGPSA